VLTGILLSLLVLAILGLAVAILYHAKRGARLDFSPVSARFDLLEKAHERAERAVREESATSREESATQARNLREEVGAALSRVSEGNEQKFERLRATVEEKLTQMQADNARKLEDMRTTVDEKLEGTLERRLGQSFTLVSERLEQVHKGLGEMQSLAAGVGDLKRVLTNVKTRGTWGEMRLASILEDILAPDQYAPNVATKDGSAERVEFAIKLPGRDEMEGQEVWLPIDSKFPMADYESLVAASEAGDPAGVEAAAAQIQTRIKDSARTISDKYLNPPKTTDFAIMFLPSEGLFAEVVRKPGLVAMLQQQYRVNVAGPTTLAALLNSLQMGFRTLAIQKRSSEVWAILGAVKTEFGKFGQVLGKVKRQLDQASNTIDQAGVRTRAIERRLRDVQGLPSPDADALLEAPEAVPRAGDDADNDAGDA